MLGLYLDVLLCFKQLPEHMFQQCCCHKAVIGLVVAEHAAKAPAGKLESSCTETNQRRKGSDGWNGVVVDGMG